jgi:hypothetical protein
MTVIAAFAGVVALVLLWHKAAPRAVLVCMLLAGIGVAGWGGHILASLGDAAGRVTENLTTKLFGVGVAGVLVLGLGIWLWFGLTKKGPPAQAPKALPWVALVFPALLPLLGGALGTFGNSALHGIGSTLSTVVTDLVVG